MERYKDLEIPMIHLNGSSGDYLSSAMGRIIDELTKCSSMMGDIAPHMRDWYLKPDARKLFELASGQHFLRCRFILDVAAELIYIKGSIDQEMRDRKHGRSNMKEGTNTP